MNLHSRSITPTTLFDERKTKNKEEENHQTGNQSFSKIPSFSYFNEIAQLSEEKNTTKNLEPSKVHVSHDFTKNNSCLNVEKIQVNVEEEKKEKETNPHLHDSQIQQTDIGNDAQFQTSDKDDHQLQSNRKRSHEEAFERTTTSSRQDSISSADLAPVGRQARYRHFSSRKLQKFLNNKYWKLPQKKATECLFGNTNASRLCKIWKEHFSFKWPSSFRIGMDESKKLTLEEKAILDMCNCESKSEFKERRLKKIEKYIESVFMNCKICNWKKL
ncbi:MAG: hypothetical protein KDK55_07075 [Chlamydiia bacterium]|nr:hypothetical protein [Chlamydiia bacterium]